MGMNCIIKNNHDAFYIQTLWAIKKLSFDYKCVYLYSWAFTWRPIFYLHLNSAGPKEWLFFCFFFCEYSIQWSTKVERDVKKKKHQKQWSTKMLKNWWKLNHRVELKYKKNIGFFNSTRSMNVKTGVMDFRLIFAGQMGLNLHSLHFPWTRDCLWPNVTGIW